MKKATIYHNPRCSKSRSALELLQSHLENIHIIDYMKQPLTSQQLRHLLELLNISPSDLVRKNEKRFKELALDNATGCQTLEAMANYPELIERPIVVVNSKACIARPAEKLLSLLEG